MMQQVWWRLTAFTVATVGLMVAVIGIGNAESRSTFAQAGATPTSTPTGLPRGVYFPPAVPGEPPAPDHYTISVMENAGDVAVIAGQLAQQYGLTMLYIRVAQPGFNAVIPASQVAAVRADARVSDIISPAIEFNPYVYAVFLRASIGDPNQAAQSLAQQFSLTIRSINLLGSPYFTAIVPAEQVTALMADPRVLSLDEDVFPRSASVTYTGAMPPPSVLLQSSLTTSRGF